jgi:DNA-binding LacI/PurR family transcriptional regulator
VDINPGALEYLRTEMEPQAVPIAFLDTSYHRDWGIHIVTDDEMGCRLALEHLRELGHRRIGFIGGKNERGMSQLRELFFRQIAAEMGLEVRPESIAHGDWNPDVAFDITLGMMNLPQRPTAIFCANDEMATGVQRAGRHLGLKLPDQLSVIGFSDVALARLADPALTTVAQPMEEMGQQATRSLLDVILENGKGVDVWGSSTKWMLPTRLVVRESTGRVEVDVEPALKLPAP